MGLALKPNAAIKGRADAAHSEHADAMVAVRGCVGIIAHVRASPPRPRRSCAWRGFASRLDTVLASGTVCELPLKYGPPRPQGRRSQPPLSMRISI